MQVLEIGPGSHPHPEATVRIDVIPNPRADHVMNAEEMTFPSGSFDMVLMFECLEHVENPLKVLKEIQRVLVKGGVLSMSIPNVYYYCLFLRWALKGKVTASKEHLWNWSSWEITNLLERAGLKVEKIEPYNEDWNNKPSMFLKVFPRIAAHSILIRASKLI